MKLWPYPILQNGRQPGGRGVYLGKVEICVFRAYGLDAEAPEKEWRRHRGTLESVSAVENHHGCLRVVLGSEGVLASHADT